MQAIEPESVLRFWFGEPDAEPLARIAVWWGKSADTDDEIRRRFVPAVEAALRGDLDSWCEHPKSNEAYILLLDQFTRQVWRGQSKAFSGDVRALSASLEGQRRGWDRQLSLVERWFFYMPMEHAENIEIQEKSVRLFKELRQEAPAEMRDAFEQAYRYAVQHREIIKRFGRFPHRNAILGRASSASEIEFLMTPGSSF